MKIEKYKNTKNKKRLFALLFMALLLVTVLGFNLDNAQAQSIVESTDPNCYNNGNCELNDFVRIFKAYYLRILGLIGGVALLMFIIGGVKFLVSAGNPEQVSGAKKLMISAIIGLVIIFSSFLIIDFVIDILGYQETEFGAWNTTL